MTKSSQEQLAALIVILSVLIIAFGMLLLSISFISTGMIDFYIVFRFCAVIAVFNIFPAIYQLKHGDLFSE